MLENQASNVVGFNSGLKCTLLDPKLGFGAGIREITTLGRNLYQQLISMVTGVASSIMRRRFKNAILIAYFPIRLTCAVYAVASHTVLIVKFLALRYLLGIEWWWGRNTFIAE